MSFRKVLSRPAPLLVGIGVYASTVYIAFHSYKIYSLPQPEPNCHLPNNQMNYSYKYNELKNYDSNIEWDEFIMSMPSKRKYLAEMAKGDVLEVSAGTGRNLEFFKYDSLTTLTAIDYSKEMLLQAVQKFKQYKPKLETKKVFFNVMQGEKLLFGDDEFDSVIDTFGLCSHHDPVEALKEMARVCKPDGVILLLEHGRSEYAFVNDALDKTALMRKKKLTRCEKMGVLVEQGYQSAGAAGRVGHCGG
jgi:methyltransferase OMS1